MLVLALSACGGGSKKSSQSTTRDANGCIPVSAPATGARSETKPTKRLSPTKTYDVTFLTNCGSFTIRLATKTSPATTASFAGLAQKGFFDHTIFHRIVPGFVIQGGDPTGTGTGGPGYTTVDAPPASTRVHPRRGRDGEERDRACRARPAASSSSSPRADAQLPPDYAVLGKVVRGLPVVQRIGKLGDPASGGEGTPTETVEIEKATVHVR